MAPGETSPLFAGPLKAVPASWPQRGNFVPWLSPQISKCICSQR
jgi:hypothetical protein